MLKFIFMASICHDPGRNRDAVFLYNVGDAIFFGPSNVLDDVSAVDNIRNVADRAVCRPLSAPGTGKYKH